MFGCVRPIKGSRKRRFKQNGVLGYDTICSGFYVHNLGFRVKGINTVEGSGLMRSQPLAAKPILSGIVGNQRLTFFTI